MAAMAGDLPDASSKLRLVLDYLPCEACLAQPVKDQDLLCGVCARLHRQVAVRVATRTSVILERPSLPPAAAPVVIPPAAPQPQPQPQPQPEPQPAPLPLYDIITEPLVEAPPVPLMADAQDEPAEAVMPVREPEPEPEPTFDDEVAAVEPTDDLFEVSRGETVVEDEGFEVARREPEPVAEPQPFVEPETESDYIFRPPAEPEPEPQPDEQPEPEPVEEVPVEPLVEEEPASPWAPPEEIFADEPPPEPQPQPVEEEVVEMEVLPDEEILEATIVEDEPIEAEVLGEETGETDLRRLRGVGPAEEQALRDAGVDGLASLAGHDPHDLASRTGLAADALASWLHVANLVQEVGVPIDSAVALVAAGVEGPRGLRDLDEQEILDRVEARGGLRLSGRDVKRWKRRA